MRVAIVTNCFPDSPDAPKGGVAAAVSTLAAALANHPQALDVHVVHCAWGLRRRSFQEGDSPYTVHTASTRAPGALSVLPCMGPAKVVGRILREIRPDVVHVQGAAFFLNGRRYPSVLTVHGIMEENTYYRARRLRHLRRWLVARREGPARRRYKHVIAIAGYVAQRLSGQLEGRCHFVPNAVDCRFFEVRRENAGPRILFAGPLTPEKNLHGVIDAVGILARDGVDCTLRLAGRAPGEVYAEDLGERMRKLGIRGRIEFLGLLDRAGLLAEMRAARCLVLASFQETAPMVIAEAAAAGLPSVVSPAGGSAEMVTHLRTGMLVDARSPASIAAGLRPLVESAELADELGRNARDRAQLYHPQRVADQTVAVYECVLQNDRAEKH